MVPMALNIKNDETLELARRVAAETGETLTGAIATSLQARLDSLHRERHLDARMDRINVLVAECVRRGSRSIPDHGEYLYDEMGLPK